MTTRSDYQRLFDLWRAIEQAGGVNAYVEAQLRERGFVLERKKTDEHEQGASSRAYKKSLKAEAEERRQLKKEAWQAYKANHIVHLGEGVFWNDEADPTSGTCPTPRSAPPRTSCRRSTRPQQAGRGPGPDGARAALAGLPPRRGRRASTTAASPSPSATARERAIWAPHAEAQGGPALDPAQHRREAARSTGRATASSPAARSPPTPPRTPAPKVVVKMDIKDFFPTVTLPPRQGHLPQGRLPRAGGDAAGAALHRGAARGRRARGQDLLRRARPALPAAGGADQPGADQHAVPAPRPAAHRPRRRSSAGATRATPTT